jgi:hypothetical protein
MSVSNGRWRQAETGPTLNRVANLLPQINEVGFTIYVDGLPSPPSANMVFTKPSGATLVVGPWQNLMPLRNERTGQILRNERTGQVLYGNAGGGGYGYYTGYFGTLPGTGAFSAYIFDVGDLNEAGTWSVGFPDAIGTFPVSLP